MPGYIEGEVERVAALATAAAGFLNGLLGSGGGMVLLPVLLRRQKQEPRRAFATSLGILLPLSALSAGLRLWQSVPEWTLVWPVVLGGAVGGGLGGRWFQQVPVAALRTIFALFLLYAGGRYLLG